MATMEAAWPSEVVGTAKEEKKKKGKQDKPKPWDEDPNIDRWKIEKFDPSWNEGSMLEVSSFSALFPQYREKYLQDTWPMVKSALKEFGVACELNLAIKILDEEMYCDIIKIGNLVRNEALEILTGCYILVQFNEYPSIEYGNTIAAMGPFKELKKVGRIAEDCIQNKMHPVYHIKILMMKKELEKDPALKNENWDRKNVKQKKVKSKEKKPYMPFPPPQQPSKVDVQLETGEYFLSEQKKQANKWREKQEKQEEKTAENKRKRETAFIPPEEPIRHDADKSENNQNLAAVTTSLKQKTKEFGKQKSVENVNGEDYVAASGGLPQRKKFERT